jgi:hypothetical protein
MIDRSSSYIVSDQKPSTGGSSPCVNVVAKFPPPLSEDGGDDVQPESKNRDQSSGDSGTTSAQVQLAAGTINSDRHRVINTNMHLIS